MRILGIDYGDRRVGLAFSDEDEAFAFPLIVLKNTKHLISEINKVIQEKKIGLVVVGESLDYNGQANLIMKDVDAFVEQLAREANIEVVYEPEFLTSVQAERFQGYNELIDASAASIILQSYLDRKKNL